MKRDITSLAGYNSYLFDSEHIESLEKEVLIYLYKTEYRENLESMIRDVFFNNLDSSDFIFGTSKILFKTFKDICEMKYENNFINITNHIYNYIFIHESDSMLFYSCMNLLIDILSKKRYITPSHKGEIESIQKLLDRKFLSDKEEILEKMHSGNFSDSEVKELVKKFESLERKVVKNPFEEW